MILFGNSILTCHTIYISTSANNCFSKKNLHIYEDSASIVQVDLLNTQLSNFLNMIKLH